MKNMPMLGGALLISYFGASPISLDEAPAKKTTGKSRKFNPSL